MPHWDVTWIKNPSAGTGLSSADGHWTQELLKYQKKRLWDGTGCTQFFILFMSSGDLNLHQNNSWVLGHHQEAQPVPAAKYETFFTLFCLYPGRIKWLFIKNSWHVQKPPFGLGRRDSSDLLEKLTEKNNNNRPITSSFFSLYLFYFSLHLYSHAIHCRNQICRQVLKTK